MKKVLLLTSLYHPNIGGVENSIREISKSLAGQGYQVYVVCNDRDYVNNNVLPPLERSESQIIYRYGYPRGGLGVIRQLFTCIKLLRSFRHVDFDLVLARSHIPLVCAWLAGQRDIKYLVPSVWLYQDAWFQNSSLSRFGSKLYNSFLQLVGFLVADVYVFSATAKKQVETASFGLAAPTIVKPGVDQKKFKLATPRNKSRLRKVLGFDERDIVLLGLGRFAKLKQFDLLIKCLPLLPDHFKLVLVGDGPERNDYSQCVKLLGLEGRVRICGATHKPHLFYQLSDVFCMTSRYEAFGQVLLEATSSGLPIAAFSTRSGVNTAVESIYREYPCLVAYTNQLNESGLADAVVRAVELHSANAFSNSCFAVSRDYSWEKLVRDLAQQ